MFALVASVYYAFAQPQPFSDAYSIRATFTSASGLRPGNPVRVAGVQIGTVERIDRGPDDTANVEVRITDQRQPIHADATFEIRPRLFLEGNNMIVVRPGSPGAPIIGDDGVIPLSQTSTMVQIDQVLSALTAPVRSSLQSSIGAFAEGLGGPPLATGAGGVRRSITELDRALGSYTRVARALQGTRPGDLHRAIESTGEVTTQLASASPDVGELLSASDRVLVVLTDNRRAVRETITEAAALTREAPRDLAAVQALLPVLTRTARDLEPALAIAPRALRRTTATVRELDGLSRQRELPQLLDGADPLLRVLPTALRRARILFGRTRPVTDCVSSHVVPTLNRVIEDGPNTTGRPVWQDLLHVGPGLAAASPNFDGNGTTIRLGIGAGEQTLSGFLPGLGQITGSSAGAVTGVQPTSLGPGVDVPYRPDADCADQVLPDLTKRRAAAPAALARVRDSGEPAPSLADLRRSLRALLPKPTRRRAVAPTRPQRPVEPKAVTPRPSGTPLRPQRPSAAPPVDLGPTLEAVEDLLDGVLKGLR